MPYPPTQWTDKQYRDYLELRSRLYSLMANTRCVRRQLKKLHRALCYADPQARELVISEPEFQETFRMLIGRTASIEWHHRHHPASLRRIHEYIQDIFVNRADYTNPSSA